MIIGGLQKTTLIDYPGKIACTIFIVGCNYRCPFCHNKDLVTTALFEKSKNKPITKKEIFDFLKKRKNILDGVCITGGEPTINPNLSEFIRKIKKIGYFVKLDTNGSNPKMLKKLIKQKLLDYVAMDIKSNFDNYKEATKSQLSVVRIKKSIKIILQSGLDYEFRTTVVPSLHNKENLVKLAKQLEKSTDFWQLASGSLKWFFQPFRPQNCLDPKFLKVKPYSNKQMNEFLLSVKKTLPNTKLRGGD